jgi:dTDP-glucose 4,6-dehydratase
LNKRILITGGSGFIGTNLHKELSQRGHDLFSIDLLNTNRDNYERCDVSQFRQIESIFKKHGPFDFVYHLAAEYGRWNGEAYYEQLWQTNVIGTKNIIRLQEEFGFNLIFFSSAEVYGDYSGLMAENVMEHNPIKDTYQMNDYAISKWAGELMCMNSTKMFGTNTVRVRPVNCYGPHEDFTPYRGFVPKFIYSAIHKIPFVVHRGHKRIIDYVEDSCRTWANISDNFISGQAYNIGGRIEWERSIEDYCEIILKVTGASSSLVSYKEVEENTTLVKTIDFSKAISDLKHDPKISPEEGIERTVDWMKFYYRK